MTSPNGVTHSYTYDNKNRLTNLGVNRAATAIASYAYTLDAAGHRTSVTELSGRKATYGYDNLYRLTSETIASDPGGQNGTISYVYDPVGNRKQMTSTVPAIPAGLWNYDANDRFTAGDLYDANGNTISSGGIANVYDFENRLIQKGGATIVYDGDGNRVKKTVAGITTTYLVSDSNPTGYAQVLNESFSGSTSGNREASHTYVYGLERISETRSYLVNSQSLTQRIFYVYDGHGSVRALTDSTGAVTDTYDYDAFGKLIHSTGTTPNIYLYSGEQFDPDLNLYYNRARYLNVSTGRFWSMDAFEGDPEAPLSLHKYLFVGADPIDAVDPSGYDFGDIAISLAIQGVLSASVSGLITYGITRNVKKSLAAAAGGFVLGVVFGAAGQVVKGLFVARAAGALALAAEDTLITADKLRYLLELDAGKALGFKLLGYTLENVEDLEAVLQASRQLITEETERVVTQYGTKYAVQMEIIGANGMRGLIQVVWQQDIGSTIFRLITAIPKPYGVFYF